MTPRANIIWWFVLLALTFALALVAISAQVTVSWPATGGTNRVMLDGVQQSYTAGTNTTIQVTNDVWPATVQIIGGTKCYRLTFSIDPVARWTGQQEFSTNLQGPWSMVTLKPGAKLPANGGGYFRAVLTKQPEIVQWWQIGGREGRTQ